MLRGPGGWSVAVRRVDGEIAVASHPDRRRARSVWHKPFVRGLHAIATAVPLGMRSMDIADQIRRTEPRPAPTTRQRAAFLFSLAGAIGFAVVLFGVLPAWAGGWLADAARLGHAGEPLVRTAVIVAYVAAVGRLADVRDVFAYHGAEHQVVAAHEFGAAVDAVSARNFPRFHPRCGTSFVLLVAVIDGLVEAVIPAPSGPAFRLLQLPIAIMLAYEVLQLALRAPRRAWSRAVLAPGRALQRLTTRAPDHGQLEVACAALDAVLLLGTRSLEDQNEQQDDQDQNEQSTTDVHHASSVRVTKGFSEPAAAETSG
jgi:uncharacterized protein YqhQ